MRISTRQARWWLFAGLWFLTACVTVNVYFPAAAAERAAEQIIDDVWGGQPTAGESAPVKESRRNVEGSSLVLWSRVVTILLPTAEAAANINIDTPAINSIKSQMAARFNQLQPFYQSGAVGLTRDGLVAVRDLNAVPLKDRNRVQQLVAQENRNRNDLYREIAKANGHPEWESQIRATFAREWINKARSGWWYQDAGGWRQK